MKAEPLVPPKDEMTEFVANGQPSTQLLLVAAYKLLRTWWYLILPTLFLSTWLRRRWASPLRQYPGPFIASCSRLWKVISVVKGHTELDHIAIHRKYGPIVRIAPNEVSLCSPNAAKEILSAGKGFYKTDFYDVFPPPENPDIFTETREHVHAQKKRVAAHPYSLAAMQQLNPFIESTIRRLVSKLDGYADGPTKICDLGNWLHYFAFDVLGEVAFSRSFGFLEAGFDVGNTIKAIDDSQWYNGIVAQVPFLDRLLRRNPLWNYVPFLATKNALITRIALAEMEKRKPFDVNAEKESDRRDLLDSLIKGHKAKPDQFSESDVFAVAHGAIFAGSDSTASTMQSFFYFILKDLQVYDKLCAEIDSANMSGKLSSKVQWSEAQTLLYFQACLDEAMRLRPAVGLNISRLVPPGGAEINGTKFPGGTRVAVNAWVLHRDKETFGADADKFRPERWLEDQERTKIMKRYMFQFGGGAHLCIGKNLALLEMNKVLPNLLRDYTFRLVDPNMTIKYHSTFFVVQHGLEVCIERRTSVSEGRQKPA